MDSRANAWAWRKRLTPAEQEAVIERTADVARLFYSDDELSIQGTEPRDISRNG